MHKGTIIIWLLLVVLVTDVVCRGGRGGGGGRGGFRGGGGRGGFRGGSSRGSRSRGGSSYGRTSSGRYTSAAGAFAAGYTIAGLTRYRSRYYGTRYYSSDPPVCYNTQRWLVYDNGTLSSTLKLNYFVCPFETSDDPSATYCCGDEGKQKCCTYWDSPGRTAGAIIGIIIGVIVVIGVLVCVIKCCCADSCKLKRSPAVTLSYQAPKPQNSLPAHQHSDTSYEKPAYPAAPNGNNHTAPGQSPYYQPSTGAGYPPQPVTGAGYPPQTGTGTNYPAQPTAGGIGFEGVGSEPPPPSYDEVNQPQKA